MDNELVPHAIPPETALPWMQSSLSQGAALSQAVRTTVPWTRGDYFAIAPVGWRSADPLNLAVGGVTSSSAAPLALVRVINELAAGADACLIVEDDLRRADDSATKNLPLTSAFIDECLVHWSELPTSSADFVAATITRGASGYPLNAFVVSRSCRSLGFEPDVQGTAVAPDVASGVFAIIVSAFDAESFLYWRRSP